MQEKCYEMELLVSRSVMLKLVDSILYTSMILCLFFLFLTRQSLLQILLIFCGVAVMAVLSAIVN